MTDLIKRDDALLPCPFCGGDKNTICKTDYDGRDAYAVSCRYPNCHGAIFMLGYGYFTTKEEAMAAWNERGPLTPEPDEVEKPQPITPEEVFMEAVWDALKADTSDLGKQARILAAYRAATPAVDIAQLTAEVAKFIPAHDAAIREAVLREAADVAQRGADILGGRMRDAKDKKEKRDWQSMLFAAVDIKDAILALIGEQK